MSEKADIKMCNSCVFFTTEGDRGICNYFDLPANWNDRKCVQYIRIKDGKFESQ